MCKHSIRVVLYFDLYTKLCYFLAIHTLYQLWFLYTMYSILSLSRGPQHCQQGNNIVKEARKPENNALWTTISLLRLTNRQQEKCFWATKFWGMLVSRQLVGKRWFPKKRGWCFFFSRPTSSVSSLLSSWKLLLDLRKLIFWCYKYCFSLLMLPIKCMSKPL